MVTATGFPGYREMYRALREINTRVRRIDDGRFDVAFDAGQFDVAFDADRIDEIGETYDAVEETARSPGAAVDRAGSEREVAETERERVSRHHADLEAQASAFGDTMRAAADDLSSRLADRRPQRGDGRGCDRVQRDDGGHRGRQGRRRRPDRRGSRTPSPADGRASRGPVTASAAEFL